MRLSSAYRNQIFPATSVSEYCIHSHYVLFFFSKFLQKEVTVCTWSLCRLSELLRPWARRYINSLIPTPSIFITPSFHYVQKRRKSGPCALLLSLPEKILSASNVVATALETRLLVSHVLFSFPWRKLVYEYELEAKYLRWHFHVFCPFACLQQIDEPMRTWSLLGAHEMLRDGNLEHIWTFYSLANESSSSLSIL